MAPKHGLKPARVSAARAKRRQAESVAAAGRVYASPWEVP